MKLSLIVVSIVLVPLISAPASAQSASEDQYEAAGDQYEPHTGVGGVGGEAANAALEASAAFGSALDSAVSPPAGSATAVESAESGTTEDEDVDSEDSDAAIDSSETPAEPQADDERAAKLTVLPETGGPSPLWLGVLLVVGGLLVRGVAWRVRAR